MKHKNVIIAVLAVLLITSSAAGFYAVQKKSNQISSLKKELADLKLKEKRSAIDKEVSRQLEEIASQQEALSDQRRREAEQQTERANQMSQQADMQRERAVKAQNEALEALKNAERQKQIAEEQRRFAEEKQRDAEYSKSVVDTLSYRGLGRSLASLSSTQYQAGETQTAALLAAAACYFTEHYNGDFYDQSIFKALIQSGAGAEFTNKSEGSIAAVEYLPNGNMLYVNTFGEIFHVGTKETEKLFNNQDFDFRDLKVTSDGKAYALSFNSQLVIIDNLNYHIVPIPDMARTFCLSRLKDGNMLIAGGQTISVFDTKKEEIIKTITCPDTLTCVTKNKVFDTKGEMYQLTDNLELQHIEKPFKGGIITAYTESDDQLFSAFGTREGVIYFNNGGNLIELAGHQSKISDLAFSGRWLFSSSYDKTVKLWTASEGKIEPITLFTTQHWIMCLAAGDAKRQIVTGDNGGNLTVCKISPNDMILTLKKTLKRDFTKDEWNYYIGEDIPYTPIKDQL